jgi:hypothetical protein
MLYRRDGERTLVGGCSKPGGSPAAGPLVIRGVPGVGSLALRLDTRERPTDILADEALGRCTEWEVLDRLLTDPLPPAQEEPTATVRND